MKRPGTTDINKISNTRGHEGFSAWVMTCVLMRTPPGSRHCVYKCLPALSLMNSCVSLHMPHMAARKLRSSIPATERDPCHSIALYSVGSVRNVFTHVSPKQTEANSRMAAESECPPTETLPHGDIPGGAVVPHTRGLVHRQPYNESKLSLFSTRDQGRFRANEIDPC